MNAAEHTHYRTCHLCEAICGVEIRVRGTEILSIRGDEQDPFSRGHLCPKALGLKDVHEDPDRLRRPMRRTATGWEEVSWDAALDEVARRLVAIQREHGADAVASYLGNPQVHNYGALLGGGKFLRALRSRNRYSATSVDQLPHHLSAYLLYGHQLMIPVPDIDRTQFFLVIGGNPVVVLEIARAARHPVRFKGQMFIRVGSYKKKLEVFPEKERALWRIFDQTPFEDGLAIDRITAKPAAILGIDAGHLTVGAVADVCIFDPEAYWRVEPAALYSLGKNTPFSGFEMRGRVTHTLVSGNLVYEKK